MIFRARPASSPGIDEIARRYRVDAIAAWRARARAKLARIIAAAVRAAASAAFVAEHLAAELAGQGSDSVWGRQRAALEARGIIRPCRDHGLPGIPGDLADVCPTTGPPISAAAAGAPVT